MQNQQSLYDFFALKPKETYGWKHTSALTLPTRQNVNKDIRTLNEELEEQGLVDGYEPHILIKLNIHSSLVHREHSPG